MNAPEREGVFRFVADLENALKWNYAIVETLEVTELDPVRHFAFRATWGPSRGRWLAPRTSTP